MGQVLHGSAGTTAAPVAQSIQIGGAEFSTGLGSLPVALRLRPKGPLLLEQNLIILVHIRRR